MPDSESPFEILCDEWTPDGRSFLIELRIAHELAHTLFYDWAQRPPRHLRSASVDEEAFCDAFAEAFVFGAEPD